MRTMPSGSRYAVAASMVMIAPITLLALQSRSGPLFEHQLIHAVIDADRLDARMAEVCLAKASQEQLRKACRDTLESRTAEINQLQNWSALWYSTSATEHNDIKKDPKMKKLAAARKTSFDSVFLAHAIAQQELVLSTLNGCEESASHSALKEFCQQVRTSRTEQKHKFENWLSIGFSEPESVRR